MISLKAGLLAFRARHLGEALPQVDKPIAGRLGDIMQPLLCVAELLPEEASEALRELIEEFETERKEAESESLAGRISQALHDRQYEIESGKLPVEKIREKINEGVDEKFHVAPQTIGRELSAMGIKRKKSEGKMQVIFDQKIIDRIWRRFPPQGYLPNLPNLPNADKSRVSDREIKNGNLPNFPESREEREEAKINLPAGDPYEMGVREEREEREVTPGEGEQSTFLKNTETLEEEEGVL